MFESYTVYVCCTCNGRVSRCCHIESSFTGPSGLVHYDEYRPLLNSIRKWLFTKLFASARFALMLSNESSIFRGMRDACLFYATIMGCIAGHPNNWTFCTPKVDFLNLTSSQRNRLCINYQLEIDQLQIFHFLCQNEPF